MKYTEEALAEAVDAGEISEDQALKMLQAGPARAPANSKNINKTYDLYKAGKLSEEEFYAAVLAYIVTILRSKSQDEVEYSHLEDIVSTTAVKVWKSLDNFNAERGSFARYISVIASSEITNLHSPEEEGAFLKRASVSLDTPEVLALTSHELSPEKKTLFTDWMRKLLPMDRDVIKMSMDGLTTREIGELLDVSHMTVSRILKRIKDVTKPPF